MESLVVKEFGGIEYLKIKEARIEENTYLIFMDTSTQSKVVICDRDLKEVKDKEILFAVLEKVFNKKSDIEYKKNDEEYDEEDGFVPGNELNDSELQEFFSQMELEFFCKFGNNLLSKEKLEYKIKNGIESVEISPKPEGFKKDTARSI